jgi:hypothetical protein
MSSSGKSTSNGKSSSGSSHSAKRHESSSKESKSVSPFSNGFRSESRGHATGDRLDSRSRSGSVEIKVTDSATTSGPSRDEHLKARSSLSSNVSSLSTSVVAPDDDVNDDDDVIETKRRRSESPARWWIHKNSFIFAVDIDVVVRRDGRRRLGRIS